MTEKKDFAQAYISLSAAAEYVGVSRITMRRFIHAGRLPAYRIGPRTIRIKVADLEEFIRGGVA